ncbi:MAG: iron export ABC transporter permease subunit FetB [Silvibacterium sp.]|nr:iron export ABC transporter permease subunit FetB [Silvibacterium sp.]
MFEQYFSNQLARGAVYCAITAAATIGVILLARRRAPGLLREVPLAELRGILQIVAVGAILAALLRGPAWTSIFVLAGMILAAASIVCKRAKRIPGAFALALIAIGAGAGSVLVVMTVTGVIPLKILTLIPVGSMVIANTMNTQSIFLDRFRGEIAAHVGEIESALALGATPDTAVERYLQAAFRASLIPAVDNIRSLGIVWIPGIMAGMVLSGSSPLYAALYQFVVLTTIFSSSALACFVASHLVTRRVVSVHAQLVVRA